MTPDQTKVWTRQEVRERLGAILVESLGVEAGAVKDGASLVNDLGAESIDFLDVSFKAQQEFGVDLPTRLIQDRILEWRNLGVLAQVLGERHGLQVPAEALRGVTPATIPAVYRFLREAHGLEAPEGAGADLGRALAERLVSQMGEMGCDMAGLDTGQLAAHLADNLHSPKIMQEVLQRFTVGALADHLAGRLAAASRLAG
jgi:acyl carrier protein